MKGEPLKGHLDMIVMASLRNKPRHGYAIIETIRLLSGGTFDLAEGTIYPALHRLERAGLLASRWAEYEGRRRRIYRLTRAGCRSLAAQTAQWSLFSQAVTAVVEALA